MFLVKSMRMGCRGGPTSSSLNAPSGLGGAVSSAGRPATTKT